MAKPTTREEFKQYCLRKLGAPVIEINVDDDQVTDRIDDALDYYRAYHYDGTFRDFHPFEISQADIDNKYITMLRRDSDGDIITPADDYGIRGVINIFPIGTGLNTNNIFNLKYQISLNDAHNWARSGNLSSYISSQRRVALLEEVFTGKKGLRFNQLQNELHIDMDWDANIVPGQFIIVECYKVIPEENPELWGDRWLLEYATAIIKKQWGTNLKKFDGVQLPGGVTFNGQTIWQEGDEEQRRLEEEMITNHGAPLSMLIG